MKRVSLHAAFWLLYILQDTLLVYTWIGPLLGPLSDSRLAWVSFSSALIMVIPKLLLVYYVLYVSIKKILNQEQSFYRIGLEIFFVLFVSIIAYRLLSKYIVNPHIYNNGLKSFPVFEIRSMLMALMDIGAVTGLAVFVKFIRIQVTTKEREKNMIKEKLETELKFLRNQTNPHFLMNTLNNIYALARKKSDETPEIVMKLSELLRFILYESGEKRIKLADEVKVVEDYLELEKMRYSERLSIRFDKSIDYGSYQITPLLLLPFVENAFKHGVSETRFESFVYIDLVAKDGVLEFNIENSKDSKVISKNPNAIGLKNVRRQLELMYREHQLEVRDENTCFKAHLRIKLDSYVEI